MNLDFSSSLIPQNRQAALAARLQNSSFSKNVCIYFPQKSFESLYLTELFLIIENLNIKEIQFHKPIFDLSNLPDNMDCLLNFGFEQKLEKSISLTDIDYDLWSERNLLFEEYKKKNITCFEIYHFSPFILANGSNIDSIETNIILEKINSLLSIILEEPS